MISAMSDLAISGWRYCLMRHRYIASTIVAYRSFRAGPGDKQYTSYIVVAKRISFTALSSAMRSSRSNLFTNCNFIGGT